MVLLSEPKFSSACALHCAVCAGSDRFVAGLVALAAQLYMFGCQLFALELQRLDERGDRAIVVILIVQRVSPVVMCVPEGWVQLQTPIKGLDCGVKVGRVVERVLLDRAERRNN